MTQHGGQVQPLRGSDGVVVDQRQLVPDPFVSLHELQHPDAVEFIEPAVAGELNQMIMGRGPGSEGVMDRRQLGRPRESHTQILLEHPFEYKSFPLQISELEYLAIKGSRLHRPQLLRTASGHTPRIVGHDHLGSADLDLRSAAATRPVPYEFCAIFASAYLASMALTVTPNAFARPLLPRSRARGRAAAP